jgi:hypothetical protein
MKLRIAYSAASVPAVNKTQVRETSNVLLFAA